MNTDTTTTESRIAIRTLCTEDPAREPHEKETAIHTDGDGDYADVTSFKKVVFQKLLQRPEFDVERLHVLNDDGRENTVDSLDEAAERSLTIIGVTGRIPVGAVTIGAPRNSNSHADLVK